MPSSESWQDIAAGKRKAAYELIPEAWRLPCSLIPKPEDPVSVLNIPEKSGILSETELDITGKYDAVSLVEKLASGELTAQAVTTAFSKRAAIAQQLVNCITETFFNDALERAKCLDAYLAKEGKPIGPLHGLPISIKDSFKFKGHEATLGYVSWVGKSKATTNSALVDLLLDLGAVIYVKTNIPQTLMTADSDNNVFGRTLNPHNLTLNAGGSSGGEGALVAMRGEFHDQNH
jgi:amidase